MSDESQEKSKVGLEEEPELKSERVQEDFAEAPASPLEAMMEAHVAGPRIKAERVQDRIRSMPGWTLGVGGHLIERVRDLATAFSAADYGNLVLREAARARQKVRVSLSGKRVVVTILAPSAGRERGVIGLEQLDFAVGLL
jgi:hypothetical protein